MVRICGAFIISSMTSYASIGSIVVIAVVACSTIIGNGSVRSDERVEVIMIKTGR